MWYALDAMICDLIRSPSLPPSLSLSPSFLYSLEMAQDKKSSASHSIPRIVEGTLERGGGSLWDDHCFLLCLPSLDIHHELCHIPPMVWHDLHPSVCFPGPQQLDESLKHHVLASTPDECNVLQ